MMHLHYNAPKEYASAGVRGNEYHKSTESNRKAPLKIFPISQNGDEIALESPQSNHLNGPITPHLRDPEQSSILDSSVLSEAKGNTSSDNRSETSSSRSRSRLRLKLKLNPTKHANEPAPLLNLVNLNQRPEFSARLSSNRLTFEAQQPITSTARDKPTSSSRINMQRIVVETPEIYKASSARCTNRSASCSSRSSRRCEEYKGNFHDQEIVIPRFTAMENRPPSNCSSARRASWYELDSNASFNVPNAKEMLLGARNCGFSNVYSLVSTAITSNRPMSARSGANRSKDTTMIKMQENQRSYRARVEAYFWDPSSANNSTRQEEKIEQERPFEISKRDTFSRGEFDFQSDYIALLGRDEGTNSQARESTSSEIEELAFADPMGQSSVIFEQTLASFCDSSKKAMKEGLKRFFDIDRFRELMQMAKLIETQEKDLSGAQYDLKNTAIISDTDRNKVELRKLMASPRSKQYKAFSPRIKEMPRFLESHLTMNVSESCPNEEGVQITGESKNSEFSLTKNSIVQSECSRRGDDPKENTKKLVTEFSDLLNCNLPKILCLNCEMYILLDFLEEHSSECGLLTNKQDTLPTFSIINKKISLAEELMVTLIEKIYNREVANITERNQMFLAKAAEAVVRSAHLKLNDKNISLIEKDIEHLIEIANKIYRKEENLNASGTQSLTDAQLNQIFCEQLKKVIEIAQFKRDLVPKQNAAGKEPQKFRPRSSSVGHANAIRVPQIISVPQFSRMSFKKAQGPSRENVEAIKPKPKILVSESSKKSEKMCDFNSRVRLGQNSKGGLSEIDQNTRMSVPVKVGVQKERAQQRTSVGGRTSEVTLDDTVKEWNRGMNKENYQQFRTKFIQLAVAQKKMLDPEHPAHAMLVSDLVEDAFRLDLKEHEWEHFIRTRYDNYA